MDERQVTENKKISAVLAIGVGVVVGVGLMIGFGAVNGASQMIRTYISVGTGLLLGALVYKLLEKVFGGKPVFDIGGDGSERSRSGIYGLVALIPCLIAFSTIQEIKGVKSVGDIVASFLSVALLACILLGAVRGGAGTTGRLTVTAACVFAFTNAFFYAYIPNLYNQSIWEIHHYNAVVQQIYNVAFNEPYTWESSGIYGHYAIFMWPFLKIFGHGPVTVASLLTAGVFMAEAAFIFALFKLTKNDSLRAVAIVASATGLMGQFYGAHMPTRILWPMIILAYTLHGSHSPWAEKKPGVYWGLGYILCGVALIWNTDSGVVATAVYTFSIWLCTWRSELPFTRNALRTYGLTALGCVGALLLMVAVINLYNLLCGGPFIFGACFFPILGGRGYVSGLQAELGASGDMFFLPTIVFIISIMVGMLSLRGFDVCRSDRLCLTFCGLMGLGQSYYYFNHANGSWGCVRFYVILALAFMAGFVEEDRGRVYNLYTAMKKATGTASLIILSVMVYAAAIAAPTYLKAIDNETWSTDTIRELAQAVEREVPEDTFAFGYLTQDVYAILGWDPGYHYRDSSDMFGEGIENVFEEISNHDMILVGRSNYSTIEQNCPEFSIVKEIIIGPESEDNILLKQGFYLMEKTGGAAA